MLKWALFLIGILVALVVLPMIGGMFLPRSYVVTSQVSLAQPIDSVWEVVRDLDAYPTWWSDVKGMEREELADGRISWTQRDAQSQELPIEVVLSDPPNLLVISIADERLPFRGTWSYCLEPAGSGTRLSVTEDGEIFNPVFRLMARYVVGHRGTIDRYLRALGARFNEAVVPVHVN